MVPLTTDNKDWFYQSDEFQSYFKNGTRSLIMKANPPFFTILAVSDSFLLLVQKGRNELLNNNLFEVFPGSTADPSEKNSVFNSYNRVIESKQTDKLPVFKYEIYKAETATWETEYWSNVNEPLFDAQGEVAYLINSTANITQQKLNQQALNASLQREQELNEELAATVEKLKASNEELHDSQGRMSALNNELEKRVSERTRELQESENRFRRLMEQAPVALNLFETRDMVVTFANEKMLALWDKKPEDLNRPFLAIFPELAKQSFLQILDTVFTTGEAYYGNENKAFIVRNGKEEVAYFNLIYQPIKDSYGNVVNVIQLLTEVTEQVNAREAKQLMNEELMVSNEELLKTQKTLLKVNMKLRSSEARLEQILTQLPAPVVLLSGPNQVIETTNKALLSFWDKKKEEVLGKPMLDVFPELKSQPFPAQWKHVYETGESIINWEMPVRFNRAAGVRVFYVDYHYQPLRDLDGSVTGVLATVIDNTDKMLARQAIQESEERFRNMAESTGVYISVADATSNAIYFNKPWCETTGRSMEELVQYGWLDMVHLEDKERTVTTYLEAFTDKRPFTVDFRIKKEDGEYVWLLVNGYPRFLPDGSFAGYISSSIDITERKKDEQRKNDFIGMVSHEMKTPLTSLSGYLQLLMMKNVNEDAFAVTMLGKANRQISKMTTLINGFLNVSRLESGKIQIDKQRFDMAVLIKETEEETLPMYNTHRIQFDPVEETFVHADKDKIGQVISNLISNAVKYSPFNTLVNIACITRDGNAVVSVTDKGMGIKKEDYLKLFDRYYRVNNDNATSVSGFGIGLYLCAEIVQRHDGKIWVESEVDKGSTFSFSIPVLLS